MVEKSITSRMHTWFKQKKPDQICTVYWSIEKVKSPKKEAEFIENMSSSIPYVPHEVSND